MLKGWNPMHDTPGSTSMYHTLLSNSDLSRDSGFRLLAVALTFMRQLSGKGRGLAHLRHSTALDVSGCGGHTKRHEGVPVCCMVVIMHAALLLAVIETDEHCAQSQRAAHQCEGETGWRNTHACWWQM